jgi:hypothetical protein
VASVAAVRRERERREALRGWAARHGWAYAERPATDWAPRLPGRNPRGVSLMLSGVLDGHPVAVAEYSYTETSTSTRHNADGTSTTSTNSTTHHFVVTAVRLASPGPTVAVQPRHALSKLGRTLFGDRPTALGYEPFDKAFRIVAEDPDAARRVVGPVLAGEHLAGRVPTWSLHGTELLTYRSGRITDPDQVAGLAAPLVRVAALLGR